MSAPPEKDAPLSTGAKIGLGVAGVSVASLGLFASVVAAGVVVLALFGTPLFASWAARPRSCGCCTRTRRTTTCASSRPRCSTSASPTRPSSSRSRSSRSSATCWPRRRRPTVSSTRRSTVLGWMPGGLAIVCVIASAIFTVLTGGSGVTIIAIGGLLYPALRKQGYSDAFSLGLVTTGGSVGLLLPASLPLLVYALVAHVDFNELFKAVLVPGAARHRAAQHLRGVRRRASRRSTASPARARHDGARALWELKWELGIPVLLIVGLASGADVARRGGGHRGPLHGRHRVLRLPRSRLEEGPRPHREGVDEPRRRHHPHPRDGQRAHELRRRPARADEGARVHGQARASSTRGSS